MTPLIYIIKQTKQSLIACLNIFKNSDKTQKMSEPEASIEYSEECPDHRFAEPYLIHEGEY